MEARLLNDEKSNAILLLIEKLESEVKAFDEEEEKLQGQIVSCEKKIKDAEQRQSECKHYPLLDDNQVKSIDLLSNQSIIKYDESLADKCHLSSEEKMSWAVRSHGVYGSSLNPVSHARSFFVWSGADRFIRQAPLGEYLVGPSISPETVMLKLQNISIHSKEKKLANDEFSKANQALEKLERALRHCRNSRQAHQLEIKKIKETYEKLTSYDSTIKLATERSHDPFAYLEILLSAKVRINDISYTQRQNFESLIAEKLGKIDAEINSVNNRIVHQYDHVANPEDRYHHLIASRKKLREMEAGTPAELRKKIQDLRLQKAWDTTYEVYKFGDHPRKFKHYFLGVPQYVEHTGYFAFAWLLYTAGFGFLFTPIKNSLKFFTEAFPKKMDAYCENNKESSYLALAGHYFFKAWWLCLRPITSPIVSLKAAWNSYDNFDNKYAAWAARIVLSGLSITLSLATLFTLIVVVPKAVLGLLGEAGGVVATAATAADSAILPAVPITYANIATTLRGAMGVEFDRSSSARVAARMSLNILNTSHSAIALITLPKDIDDKKTPSCDMPFAESKSSPRSR